MKQAIIIVAAGLLYMLGLWVGASIAEKRVHFIENCERKIAI